MILLQFVCVLSAVVNLVVCAKFPTDHPRCAAGDLKCIPEVINHYIQLSANGMKELNIVSIDPLSVPKVDIIQSEDSPVNIKLYTRNVDFVGFSGLRIYEAFGFTDNPDTSPFEIRGNIPQLSILGDYKITGSVLILPIVGEGRLNITMDNLTFSLKLDKNVEVRKGKTYLNVHRSFVDFNTTRTHMQLDNLFNGDKLLGDTTNLFLNENWADVINELKPALRDAMGIITGNVIRAVFDRFPYDDFWLPVGQ